MHSQRSQRSRAFERTKELFERTYPQKTSGVYAEADWSRLRTAEGLATGNSILDIGPGNGAFLQILAYSGSFGRICGADIRRHSQLLLPENVDYKIQSITELDFADNAFDTVFCMEVLEHLEDSQVETALAQLRRIAKHRLVMTVPFNEPHPLWWHDRPGGHRQQFNADRILRMFPTARAAFQPRPGVDWIFLVEGDRSETSWPLAVSVLAEHLGGAGFASPVNGPAVPPPSSTTAAPAIDGASRPAEMARNRDQIMDVYYGRLGSSEIQDHARDRIHWILSQVTGDRVLDIGCSQGLLPILLGRSGFSVLGMDLMPEAIEQATAYLLQEPASVRDLVSFEVGDASALSRQETFECVVMGEIIEHHASPSRLLKSVRTGMKPGAKIILTTPFAYHPDPDHKRTFFLSDFRALVAEEFHDVHLEVMHDFICCTAIAGNAETGAAQQSDLELLQLSERSFLSLQLGLRKQLRDVRYMLNLAKQDSSKAAALSTSMEALEGHMEALRQILGNDFVKAFTDSTEGLSSLPHSISRFLMSPLAPLSGASTSTLLPDLYGTLARNVVKLLTSDALSKRRIRDLEEEVEELKRQMREERAIVKENTSLRLSVKAHQATLKYRARKARPLVSRFFDAIESRRPDHAPVAPVKPPIVKAQESTAAPSPVSETQRWIRTVLHEPVDVPVACILDEFSWENFRFECDLYQLTKENWQAELIEKRPRFLLVESAWAGNGGNWRYKLTYSEPRDDNPLFALLAWCKKEGIPTVFWNKEDPPNYDQFLDAARRFDFIFTTDADCVPRYQQAAPASVVNPLPFAAQPALQNPVNRGRIPKLGDICFAGAWYARHPERFEDLQNLLVASEGYDLHIFDRYLNHQDHERYKFPEQYTPYIKGSLGFKEMTEKYRNYRIFLNVNSVKDSPTMFSRRVLEILACGTPVVSGYAKGIDCLLGKGIIPLVTSADEAQECISRLMSNELERDKVVLRAQREIFSKHTYRHRFQTICEALALPVAVKPMTVSVVTATIRKSFIDALLANFVRQTYPHKELLIVINENKELTRDYIDERAKLAGLNDHRVIVVPESTTLGSCLNIGVAEANGELFAKMDDDDYYGAEYLTDSVLALEYSGADCVGKESYYTYVEGQDQLYLRSPKRQHRECKFVIGTTLVGKRSLFPAVCFGDTRVGEDTIFLKRLEEAGKSLYSHSQYNYVKLYARDLSHHTWKIDEAAYLRLAVPVGPGDGRHMVCF